MSPRTPKTSKNIVGKRIIGIDPGTARVGWGVIELNPKPKTNDLTELAIAYGCIETSKQHDAATRLLAIYREFSVLIDEFKPTGAAVERLFFTKNQKTAMSVSQARGVILLVLAEKQIPVQEFTPKQVKMTMTGFGEADKQQIQYVVKQILNLDKIPQPDDAADGLALALCYRQFIG